MEALMYKQFNLDRVAKAIHEALSKTAVALKQDPYPSWEIIFTDESKKWMVDSSRNTAREVIDNPAATGGLIWRAWVKERQAAGWTHADVTDKPKKLHSMLPKEGESLEDAFRRLPWEEQLKDYVALGVALDELRAQGLK